MKEKPGTNGKELFELAKNILDKNSFKDMAGKFNIRAGSMRDTANWLSTRADKLDGAESANKSLGQSLFDLSGKIGDALKDFSDKKKQESSNPTSMQPDTQAPNSGGGFDNYAGRNNPFRKQ